MSVKQIHYEKLEHNPNDPAPLYAHYQNQSSPQPAYLELDLRDGKVTADYSGEAGNAMPAYVWSGVIRRYSVNPLLTAEQINEVVEEVKDSLQLIYENSEVGLDDNHNLAGRFLTEEARVEDERLAQMALESPLGREKDQRVIVDLAEWLSDTDYTPEPNALVSEFIKNFDLDGYLCTEKVAEVLPRMWLNDVAAGEELPPNVAQYLLDQHPGGDTSLFSEDLEAMARLGSDSADHQKPKPAAKEPEL